MGRFLCFLLYCLADEKITCTAHITKLNDMRVKEIEISPGQILVNKIFHLICDNFVKTYLLKQLKSCFTNKVPAKTNTKSDKNFASIEIARHSC